MSRYKITDLLENIDEKFAEEATDIPQSMETDGGSGVFAGGGRSSFFHMAAKAGSLAAAAAIAFIGISVVKNETGNVQSPLDSDHASDSENVQFSKPVDYEEIRKNEQLYNVLLNNISIPGLDLSEAVLTDLPEKIDGKTLYFKKSLDENREKLVKAAIEDYDPQFLQNSNANQHSDGLLSYYNKEKGTIAQFFPSGYFNYYASKGAVKKFSSGDLIKSYIISGIDDDALNDKYLVGTQELTVREMALLAEEKANKCGEAVNCSAKFKAVRIRVYQRSAKNSGSFDFAAELALQIDGTSFFGLDAQNREKLSFKLTDTLNSTFFTGGELSYMQLNFTEEMKSGYPIEKLYAPTAAALKLNSVLPKGEILKVQSVSVENVLKQWVSLGDNDHIEHSEPCWVFYARSELSGKEYAGLVECRTGQADLIITD